MGGLALDALNAQRNKGKGGSEASAPAPVTAQPQPMRARLFGLQRRRMERSGMGGPPNAAARTLLGGP